MDLRLAREPLDPLGALLADSEHLAATLYSCPHASNESLALIQKIKRQAERLYLHREACASVLAEADGVAARGGAGAAESSAPVASRAAGSAPAATPRQAGQERGVVTSAAGIGGLGASGPSAASPSVSKAASGVPVVQVPIGVPLDEVERILIAEALRAAGGNKHRAARLLGINVRTIHRRLRAGQAAPAAVQ